MTGATGLRVGGVRKAYGQTGVLHGIDLTVPRRAFHTLLGPSGSGKTTLLRVIAGFTPVDAGTVLLGGRDITQLPPERRNIGVVFQNYALFPHMTVSDNIAFGLRMRGVARRERMARVAAVLDLVRMRGFERRLPSALSGGQQQRVALARALVIEPELLLLDEPLSALDRKIRQEVREELRRIQAETQVTTIMVTHDQEEALYLADRVVVLDGGVIRQEGPPREVYQQPADAFVAGFLGSVNFVDADILPAAQLRVGRQTVAPCAAFAEQLRTWGLNGPTRLAVRPEQLEVSASAGAPDALAGTCESIGFEGATVVIRINVEGARWTALALSAGVDFHAGDHVWVRIKQARVIGAEARA